MDYVDWIVHRLAVAIDEDPTEVKAALLGYPHEHDHSPDSLHGISEEGCARGVALSVENREELAEEHQWTQGDDSSPFTIEDRSTSDEIAFRIMQDDVVFTDFGISHEKELHLFIVRDDLQHFTHLHPEREDDGTWRIGYAPPAGGTYWLYVDFVDSAISHYTHRFTRTYSGEVGKYGFVPDLRQRKFTGQHTVILEQEPYNNGNILTLHIDDDEMRAPFIDQYLGTMGHAILISQDGDFIHTHPSPISDHVTFHIPRNLQKLYRIFIQFQIRQELYTIDFDLTPTNIGE